MDEGGCTVTNGFGVFLDVLRLLSSTSKPSLGISTSFRATMAGQFQQKSCYVMEEKLLLSTVIVDGVSLLEHVSSGCFR